MLYQKNMRKSFLAKVNGEDVEITPDMISRVLARVNMGVEAQIGMAETRRLERLAGTLQGFDKMAQVYSQRNKCIIWRLNTFQLWGI